MLEDNVWKNPNLGEFVDGAARNQVVQFPETKSCVAGRVVSRRGDVVVLSVGGRLFRVGACAYIKDQPVVVYHEAFDQWLPAGADHNPRVHPRTTLLQNALLTDLRISAQALGQTITMLGG